MEFGVVARYFSAKKAGLIQVSQDDVVFFWVKDARSLKLDPVGNRVVFAGRRRLVPRRGELVVFERHQHYSALPGLAQASGWGSYSMWAIMHGLQLMNLKRLVH
jgi:hypothetical protein